MKSLKSSTNKAKLIGAVFVVAALVGAVSAGAVSLAKSQGPPQLPPDKAKAEAAVGPPPASQQGPQAPKGRGLHKPAYQPPQPPGRAGEIGTQSSLGGVPVPFSSAQFTLTNMWQDLRGTTYYSVYAGSVPSNPDVGALDISLVDGDTGEPETGSGTFDAPGATGALSLTAVHGDIVSFSFSGGTGTFDLRSDTFKINP